jgi:mannose-6-phosphate isomerase-like protein (cupin superfamily)
MQQIIKNIDQIAKENSFFRHVLQTGAHTQVVVMSIPAGGEIGEETHEDNDQILYLVEGEGKVVLDGEETAYEQHDLVLVKAGTRHNFVNTGSTDLKIVTTYSPAHHPDGTIHKTKEEADKAEY